MACKSDYQSRLKWDVHKNDSGNDELYNGYFLHPDAKSYCTVITDEPGKCYLRLIRNTAEVAQTYICVEPASLCEASADLIWISKLINLCLSVTWNITDSCILCLFLGLIR